MPKIPDYIRVVILMGILCIPPIAATQIDGFYGAKKLALIMVWL